MRVRRHEAKKSVSGFLFFKARKGGSLPPLRGRDFEFMKEQLAERIKIRAFSLHSNAERDKQNANV